QLVDMPQIGQVQPAPLGQQLVFTPPAPEQGGANGNAESADAVQPRLKQYAGFQRAMPAQPGVGQQDQRHQGGKQQRGSEVQDQPGNADIEQQQDDQRAFDAAEGVQDQADQDQVAGQGKRRQFRDIDGFAQVQDKEADGAGGIGN